MIELCTVRRMIIAIAALGILTVIVLILEEKLTSQRRYSQTPTPHPDNNNSDPHIESLNQQANIEKFSPSENCWNTEEFKVTQECFPCTKFEINSKSPIACVLTGLKEVIHCNISGTQFRSCSSIKSAEKIRFWIFESLMLLFSIVSYGFCKFRSMQIERNTIKQIERRLASGL